VIAQVSGLGPQRDAHRTCEQLTRKSHRSGVGGGTCGRRDRCAPNGQEVNPRGQGPRGYGSAARRMPALEARDAGGVTPLKYRRPSRLGRRTEVGPRRVLPRVGPRLA